MADEGAPFKEGVPVILDLSHRVRLRDENESSWPTSRLSGKIIGQRAVGNDFWIELDLIKGPDLSDRVPVGTLWVNSRFIVTCRKI